MEDVLEVMLTQRDWEQCSGGYGDNENCILATAFKRMGFTNVGADDGTVFATEDRTKYAFRRQNREAV